MNSVYMEMLKQSAPELILVIAALAVLAADVLALRDLQFRTRSVLLCLVGCVGLIISMVWVLALQADGNLWDGLLISDPLTRIVKAAIILLSALTLLISVDNNFTRHPAEYVALTLLATVGMMLLVSSHDLLMIFVSLELTSLSLYILAAFNKASLKSAEAALKYFLFGSMSAAFTLFGFSLLYGLSGSTRLPVIAQALMSRAVDPLVVVAIVASVAGFGFKIAAAPFHLWAPDAYEAAPVPSAALIASGSKVASFVVLAKVLLIGLSGAGGSGAWSASAPGWMMVLATLAAASMLTGNLAALVQSHVRRLLAYSAIAHAGYILLGILAKTDQGLSSLVFYVITYALTTVGAFAVVAAVEGQGAEGIIADYAGLSRRAPVLSVCMMVFLLSLAGIPPLAGFFGKFYLFTAVLNGTTPNLGLLWLVVLAIATSAISLYYYLLVLKQIFVAPVQENAAPLRVHPLLLLAVLLLAASVLILGCFPSLLTGPVTSALRVTP